MSDRSAYQKPKPTTDSPAPRRQDLFEWLEALFPDDERPDIIHVAQAFGQGGRHYSTIPLFEKKFGTANAAKPEREDLVKLSNELLDVIQRDCDALAKPHRYSILAKNHAKSDDYYIRFNVFARPKQPPGYDAKTPGDEIEDDEVTADPAHRDRLLKFALEHLRVGDEHERYRQDQFSTAMGDIITKYQSLADMVMKQNLEMQREQRELYKTAQEALNKQAERDRDAEMQKFKIAAMTHAGAFLKQMFPVVVNQLKGKEVIPTEDSNEGMAAKAFLDSLSEAQARLLFGDYNDEEKKLVGNGVLTVEQINIIVHVSQNHIPPAALYDLMPGTGAQRITDEQMVKAQQILRADQIMPLMAIFKQHMAKRQLPDQPPPQQPQTQPPAAPGA